MSAAPRIELSDDDIRSARECLEKAGLWPMVDQAIQSSGFTLEEILGPLRTPPALVYLRQSLWARAYAERDALNRRLHSLPELGRLFNRDHTTVMYGIKSQNKCRIVVP